MSMAGLFLLTALVLTVGSCKTREEQRAAFMKQCGAARFEPAQCAFLLSIRDAADDAAGDAATANVLATTAAIHAATRQ
jgi:hypothetical protein